MPLTDTVCGADCLSQAFVTCVEELKNKYIFQFFYAGRLLNGFLHVNTYYGSSSCSKRFICPPPSPTHPSLSFSFSYGYFYPALSAWFCSLWQFVWLLPSRGAFPGVGHMCHSLWQSDFSRNRKRFRIPQGLSKLLFHRWSEVPSRGGVRGDSP